jgi:hypothetical protein
MTPFASVVMLEKLALLIIALCSAVALSRVLAADLRDALCPGQQQVPELWNCGFFLDMADLVK